MELLQSTDFWIGLIKIIWINIILSGDNAVVIALAARSLPPAQQKKAILFGSGAAVVLRIALTVVAAKVAGTLVFADRWWHAAALDRCAAAGRRGSMAKAKARSTAA
jgi:predicted tellurium resistance membrane protein TerC